MFTVWAAIALEQLPLRSLLPAGYPPTAKLTVTTAYNTFNFNKVC